MDRHHPRPVEAEGDGEHCMKGCDSGGHVRSHNQRIGDLGIN
jgi:hypothetical protein